MKTVFHIISHFDLGGAERVAMNIARSRNPGFEHHIIEAQRAHTAFTRTMMDEMKAQGIRYHRAAVPEIRFHFLFERLFCLVFPFWFLVLYLRHRPQVIHTHTELPDLDIWAFFKVFPFFLRRCRLVRTIHNNQLWTGQPRLGAHIERFMQRHATNVAISASTQASYQRRYGQLPPIIYNGVGEVPQQIYEGLVPGKVNVLFAGRFEAQKGIPVLVRVIQALAGDDRYVFHLIGGGSMEPMMREALGHDARVVFTPTVYGLSGCLASFDYLFMPSEFEGLSLMSIEAAMAGLPAVINDCPGLGDTLPPTWPLKVSGNDVEAFVHLFRDVLPQGDRAQWGKEAQAFARTHFSIGRMQQCYEQLYTQLTDKQR